MKKIAFFCCALLALGFASCDDKSDLGTPQTNPQLPAVSASEVQPVLNAAMQGTTINLNNVAEIAAVTAPAPANMPAGSEVTFDMHLATKADFSDETIIPVVDGKVSAAEWNEYFRTQLGNNNQPLVNYVRFAAYFTSGTQQVRVGNINDWYFAKTYTVTPKSFTYPMGTVNTPGAAQASMQIADFVGDGALYYGLVQIKKDFTVTIDGVTYGKSGSNGLSATSTTPMTVSKEGLYIVEISYNAEKDTRTFKASIVRSFGAIGDFNKWARQAALTQNGMTFSGDVDFGDLANGDLFQFRFNNSNNYFLGGYKLDLIPGGEKMQVPGAGVYTMTVDLSSIPYTYSFVKK